MYYYYTKSQKLKWSEMSPISYYLDKCIININFEDLLSILVACFRDEFSLQDAVNQGLGVNTLFSLYSNHRSWNTEISLGNWSLLNVQFGYKIALHIVFLLNFVKIPGNPNKLSVTWNWVYQSILYGRKLISWEIISLFGIKILIAWNFFFPLRWSHGL